MSLGGRPKEEGGHTPLKISVNKFVKEALEKVDNKSQFIEETVKPILEQLDPGPACKIIEQVDEKIEEEINHALKNKDYKKIQALANMAEAWKDYRSLCELPSISSPKPSDGNRTDSREEIERLRELKNLKDNFEEAMKRLTL